MKEILAKVNLFFADPKLKKKFFMTLFIIFVFRVFAFLPVSIIDFEKLRKLFTQNQFLALLDIFSGGTFINFSVMALGLGPYITASIIMQLLTVVVPSLEHLAKEEGEYGRFKINQYTRFLTLPITLFQGVGVYVLLKNQNILGTLTPIEFLSFITSMIAGTFIALWFGELISEFGLGNGVSLLIFAGIVSQAPILLQRTLTTVNQETVLNLIVFAILSVFVIGSIVFINEAVRRIPVFYAKRIRGNRMYQAASNYLPLKLNQAGVIPIIFAVSFVLFPQLIGNFFIYSKNNILQNMAEFLIKVFNPLGFFYNFFYFILVVGFTYFYTVIVFNPKKISEEIQKNGGFIPGIRPGVATKEYLQKILYKITSVGAIFLGMVAILPAIMSRVTGIENLVIGGTGILIVVSVVLETFKLIEAQLVMRNYEKFTR